MRVFQDTPSNNLIKVDRSAEGMNAVPVAELKENSYFTDTVRLDENFILLTKETPVTARLIAALNEWGFENVFSDGTMRNPDEVSARAAASGKPLDLQKVSLSEFLSTEIPEEPPKGSGDELRDAYDGFVTYIEQTYSRYSRKNDLNVQEISNKVRDLCDFITAHKRFALRAQPQKIVQEKNYLAAHSMRSTVLSIVIGMQMKFPAHKLIELGVSCLLHEIGMLKLPSSLYMNDKPLSPQAKRAITAHPVLSYNILREFSFPLNICLGALEHHERLNGTGYPRQLQGDKISLYAKIISVVCSYDAITAPRMYKEMNDGYTALIDLLRNVGNQYDATVIRALIMSVSMYPIGLYVYLTNGQVAQVVDVNPENPKFPIVQLIQETDAAGKPKELATSEFGVSVQRPLSKEEWEEFKRRTGRADNA